MKGPTPHQRQQLLDLARRRAGWRVPDTLYDRLADFVHAQGDDVSALVTRLEADPGALDTFFAALSVGETYFFREERQFRLLRDHILPPLASEAPLRLWSAGCSTGEEAVSLALLAEDLGLDYHVHATDLNPAALEGLRQGRFSQGSLRDDGAEFHPLVRRVARGLDSPTGVFDLAGAPWHRITVAPYNLAAPEPGLPRFHVIFLRNVLIYFEPDLRQGVVDALVTQLTAPGYLFLSSTEVAFFSPAGVELRETEGVFYYFKATETPLQPPRPPASGVVPSGVDRVTRPHRPLPLRPPISAPTPRVPTSVSDPRVLARCFELINTDGVDEARGLLEALPSRDADRAYLLGYAAMREGLTERAVTWFTTCLELDAGHWLARFQRAVLRSARDPGSARADFTRTKADLAGSSPRFAAFLEDFHPRYFQGLCDQWINKLSGGNRGTR